SRRGQAKGANHMVMTWNERVAGVADVTQDYKVIDADTHLNEDPNLWTSRAPARFKDRVPHLRRVETDKGGFGDPLPGGGTRIADMWFIEGDQPMGSFGACTVGAAGEKLYGRISYDNQEEMHP